MTIKNTSIITEVNKNNISGLIESSTMQRIRYKNIFTSILLAVSLSMPVVSIILINQASSVQAQTREERKKEGDRLFNLGFQQYKKNQFKEALQTWKQALEIYKSIGDRQGEGTTINNIGAVYRNIGQYRQALENYQQALAISRQIGDKAGETTALNGIEIVSKMLNIKK